MQSSSNSAWLVALLLVGFSAGGGATFVYVTRTARPAGAEAGLQVLQGPAARPYAAMRRGQLIIGRAQHCDLCLHDPQVSARHATIQQTPGGYVLTDLNSTNGTYVDGQRVQQVQLRGGERVRVGHSELLFSAEGAGRAAPVAAAQARLALMVGQQEYARYTVPSGAILGGHSASPVPLNADAQVSRQHARLDFQSGQWLITDLNSTNGTYVNGKQIRQQVLRAGDEIRLGNTIFRFDGG
jgi:pSer/pThr/pTyr-binding forkhead associated (FHA) protein